MPDLTRPGDATRHRWHRSLVAGLAVALAGCAIHDVAELGRPAISNTGVLLAVGTAGVWCTRSNSHRRRAFGVDLVIAAAATLLVGGAIASVLPLPFWPWHPEQSPAHYAVHAVWAVAMVPLLVVGVRARKRTALRGRSASRTGAGDDRRENATLH